MEAETTHPFFTVSMALVSVALVAAVACGDSKSSGQPDARRDPVEDATAGDVIADAGTGARFLIHWTLLGGCLDGDEVETEISNGDDGRTFVSRFPCSAGSGLSEPLSEGEFDVLVRVIDNDIIVPPDSGPVAGPLLAQSNVSGPHLSVLDTTVDINVAFPTNTATVAAEWNFTSNSEPQTCAEAGVSNVDLEYEQMGGAIERSVRVPCSSATDASGDLPTGFYLVRATPVDDAGAAVFAVQERSVPLFVGNVGASASFGFAADPI